MQKISAHSFTRFFQRPLPTLPASILQPTRQADVLNRKNSSHHLHGYNLLADAHLSRKRTENHAAFLLKVEKENLL
jgi:hypothetical protein